MLSEQARDDLLEAIAVVTAWGEDPDNGGDVSRHLIADKAATEGIPGLLHLLGGFTSLTEILLVRHEAATGVKRQEILQSIAAKYAA